MASTLFEWAFSDHTKRITMEFDRQTNGSRYSKKPPANQKSRLIYVRPRTGPQSTQLCWPAVAKLQAASVPTA